MKKTLTSTFIKIFAFSLSAILIAVLFFNISTRISVNKIKQGGLVKSGYACVMIVSGSMEPAVAADDLLIIKSADSYNPDDIVTYVSEQGFLVTHRVKKVLANGYITQGDANNVPDHEVPAQRIIGKSVVVLNKAGIVLRWWSSPSTIVFLSFIIFLVWLIMHLKSASGKQA